MIKVVQKQRGWLADQLPGTTFRLPTTDSLHHVSLAQLAAPPSKNAVLQGNRSYRRPSAPQHWTPSGLYALWQPQKSKGVLPAVGGPPQSRLTACGATPLHSLLATAASASGSTSNGSRAMRRRLWRTRYSGDSGSGGARVFAPGSFRTRSSPQQLQEQTKICSAH